MAFAGRITFNPLTDTIKKPDGSEFRFSPPEGEVLPQRGFDAGVDTFLAPTKRSSGQQVPVVEVREKSDRLELLKPFPPWDGREIESMAILVKVKGKCTTDHISAAGPWLKYKGHLDNISNNTLIGALNADNDKVNTATNIFTGQQDTIPGVGRDYLARKVNWMVVADENYGEGSAREHAAMQPRYLGGRIILAKSFARIHETNLKKQGKSSSFENFTRRRGNQVDFVLCCLFCFLVFVM